MSQWEPEPKLVGNAQPELNDQASVAQAPKLEGSATQNLGRFFLAWMKYSPFVMSALLFASGVFMVFAPLPLVFMHMQRGRRAAFAAGLVNLLIVYLLGGAGYLALFLVLVGVIAWVLPECLNRKYSLEKSVLVTLASMAAVFGLGVLAYVSYTGANPVASVRAYLDEFTGYLVNNFPKQLSESGGVPPEALDEWKNGLLVELPSAIAIFCFIMVLASLISVIKGNPSQVLQKLGLDPLILKTWKAPFALVWPTILSGAFLIFELGIVSDVSLNIFKCLMAIFALQGLSVMSFSFDFWGLKGPFRVISFFVAIFLTMPLVLSLGFFDLWFDFRSKFRQS